MPRYIIIELNSGYIWGDAIASDPAQACHVLDVEIDGGDRGNVYAECSSTDDTATYGVYLVNLGLLEIDGQDKNMIQTVKRHGIYVATIKRSKAVDSD